MGGGYGKELGRQIGIIAKHLASNLGAYAASFAQLEAFRDASD
jgi:hypothetical protein